MTQRHFSQFETAIQEKPPCDICGKPMHALYGCGWDNDRMICDDPECGGEIVYPTSTEATPKEPT